MKTFIYMVRHGDPPKDGNERLRGLTKNGELEARRIADVLHSEGIEVVISSPYVRSILTVQHVAKQIGKEVFVFEDLKERVFTSVEQRLPDKELFPLLEKSFSEPSFALSGGESNTDCQKRAVNVLTTILEMYHGQKVAIGTHAVVMTLLMGFYNEKYNLDFLLRLSKPDIYRMEFKGQELVDVKRIWKGNEDLNRWL